MPRGVKKPSNQHNSRHENGVVAPGKRITKQKSNGHLNGSLDGASQSNAASLPTTAHTTGRAPEKRNAGSGANGRLGLHTVEDEKRSAEMAENGLGTLPDGANLANGSVEHTHRKIDVNAARTPMIHDNSMWHLAVTILRSCPLGDTIAILIFLLSLPPTFLTVSNALFAVLMFITPPAAPSIPHTFHEIFQGSGETPSLATMFLTDVIGLILWMVMWTPVQALSVELAQAVVATRLGGGTASKKKSTDRTLLCMSIVTASHVARNQWIPSQLFGYDWSAILSSIPYLSNKYSIFSGDNFIPSRSPGGWFRILIALHIVVQGLVHVARRWYQKREYSQLISVSKKADPEATAGSPNRSVPNILAEAAGSTNTTPLDNTPKSLAPTINIKDGRDRISSGKKKRKQGTYVRSQQPLWAAFAQTKVTVLREYEQSHNQTEVAGSGATDIRNLGNAPFESEEGCVWISKVLPTSFRFDTSYLSKPHISEAETDKINITSAGIDRSKPLYVRINDTDWTSTTIEHSDKLDGDAPMRWSGEVFGLTSSSSYKCSFVQSGDGVELHSAIVTTPPSLDVERGMSNLIGTMLGKCSLPRIDTSLPLAASPQRPHRPSSPKTPSTTLKDSIAAFEISLSESQARQKRSKKDNKSASAALKKDIDVFNSKIAKLAGEDKAHFNRHLQWNQNTKQADDAVDSLSAEIEALGCIPDDDLQISRECKANWDEARGQQSSARELLLQSKDDALREKSSVQSEATSTQQKRERLSGRKAKLNDQHGRLESVTTKGHDEKERKNSEQAARDLERLQLEQRVNEQAASFQRAIQESRYLTQQIWQQTQSIESAHYDQQLASEANIERSITPEGDLPGTVPRTNTPALRYSTFGSPDISGGMRSHSGSLRTNGHRPRSTSMLSGTSVYADLDDEDPTPPMPARAVEMIRGKGRKESLGSGSGSSGSHRDPASPLIDNLGQTSPVGKRSPVWN